MQRLLALEYRGIDIDPLSIDEALSVVDDALEIREMRVNELKEAMAEVLGAMFGKGGR